jgi:hypothetical protein
MVGDDEIALLRRLVASDDKHASEIYRDWLAERGDPCAELFGATANPARTEELRREWLGPLVGVTHQHQWRDGFLDGCRIEGDIERTLGHRAWATVRHLDASDWYHTRRDAVAALLVQPLLDQLRSLEVYLYDFEELRRQVRPRLETLTVRTGFEMFPRLIKSLSLPNIVVAPTHTNSTLAFRDGRLVIEVAHHQLPVDLDKVLRMLPRDLLETCELRGLKRSQVPTLHRLWLERR